VTLVCSHWSASLKIASKTVVSMSSKTCSGIIEEMLSAVPHSWVTDAERVRRRHDGLRPAQVELRTTSGAVTGRHQRAEPRVDDGSRARDSHQSDLVRQRCCVCQRSPRRPCDGNDPLDGRLSSEIVVLCDVGALEVDGLVQRCGQKQSTRHE
jgi:hypothetical protein